MLWRHYLTVAVRIAVRQPGHVAVAIGGLVFGLAACLTILAYVRYESDYDRWLPDHDRIFQVQTTIRDPGQPVLRSQNSPFPVRELLPVAFPQVAGLTIVRAGQAVWTRDGEPAFVDGAYVDPSFFDIFRLPFAHGSARQALSGPNTIVLTETEARRQLGTTDAVGRVVTMGAGPGRRNYVVSGVLRDLPRQSSLKIAVLFRYDPAEWGGGDPLASGWEARDQQHYVKLRAPGGADAINAAIPAWLKRVMPPRPGDVDLALVEIGKVHLGPAQDGALTRGGDRRMLLAYEAVAALILAMALINFINLTTARAAQRAREIGVRKLVGATRGQIVAQMVFETALAAGAAMLVALAASELAMPAIAAWIDADLRFGYLGEGGLLWPAILLFIVIAGAGSLYPALRLSGFRPAIVLRSGPARDAKETTRLRTALVFVQFGVATGLIVCTAVIAAQTRFVQAIDPGYRRDGLIQIDAAWRFAGNDTEYQAARHQLLRVPGVVDAGRTNLGLVAANKAVATVKVDGAASDVAIGSYAVDEGFHRTLDMPLAAGRLFDEKRGTDRVRRGERAWPGNVILNRMAASRLGFRSPGEAVGRTVRVAFDGDAAVSVTVVGVVGDTRIRTARDAIEPILYRDDPQGTSQVIVRYAAARPGSVMAGLHRVWKQFEPEIPFQARFAEDIVAETYAADRARAILFAAFSVLAVGIACAGLYSLAAFTAERRTKEIGIRKVFGATIADIVRLLVWQFTKPVVIANLIAWPVAWWVMRDWLNQFDVRIALTPGPFLLAGFIAFVIAFGTVAGHAIRIARTNPIHALRYE